MDSRVAAPASAAPATIDSDTPDVEAPIVVTPTHVYMALPVDQWPAAYRFIADTVGPDTPVEDDPETTSILVAINRSTYAVEGVLFVNLVVLAQHFACVPSAGVSYSKFHELVRSTIPEGAMYYSDGADHQRGVDAAVRAGLTEVGKLWYGVAVSTAVVDGVEGENAVGSDHSGGHQRSGGVSGVPEREEGGPAVVR